MLNRILPWKKAHQNQPAPSRSQQPVRSAFLAVLGRKPNSQELESYSQQLDAGNLNQESLLHTLLDSPEYIRRFLANKVWDRDLLARGSREAARSLQSGPLDQQSLQNILQEILPAEEELIIGQEGYLRDHRRRFLELANAVLQLCPEQGRLLEFGVSEFSRTYKRLRPGCSLITSDRPVSPDFPGFTPERCQRVSGCEAHVALDLEDPASSAWQELAANGPYDLILFTEVLEHLLVEPGSLLRRLLDLLSSQGLLYLTTPNFLRQANRKAWAGQQNPQPMFPGKEANWDAHYHFREYTMREILELVHGGRAAGS